MSSVDGSFLGGKSPSVIDKIVVNENDTESIELPDLNEDSLFMNLTA